MEETITLELTKDEAAHLNALLEMCVTKMKQAHEQMMKDQQEIDRLKAETRVIIARLREAA